MTVPINNTINILVYNMSIAYNINICMHKKFVNIKVTYKILTQYCKYCKLYIVIFKNEHRNSDIL